MLLQCDSIMYNYYKWQPTNAFNYNDAVHCMSERYKVIFDVPNLISAMKRKIAILLISVTNADIYRYSVLKIIYFTKIHHVHAYMVNTLIETLLYIMWHVIRWKPTIAMPTTLLSSVTSLVVWRQHAVPAVPTKSASWLFLYIYDNNNC